VHDVAGSKSQSRFIEGLESRRLLSITLAGGELLIVGNEQSNAISVSRTARFPTLKYTVVLDGNAQTFKISQISAIRITAGGGADSVTIDSRHGTIGQTRFVSLGDGNDLYNGSGGRDKVDGGNGDDRIAGGGGNDVLDGAADDDVLTGGDGNDLLTGGDGNDHLVGSDGDDLANGGDGDDLFSGGEGNDSLNGDAGNDLLVGSFGHDIIQGGDGDDFLSGGAQSNYLYGDAGDDTLTSSGAGDVLGGDAEDLLPTAARAVPDSTGNDSLNGEGGPDTLLAHGGKDTLRGGDGTDLLDARGDNHSLPDRSNGEIRPDEQVFVGPAGTTRSITLKILLNFQNVLIPNDAGNFDGGTGTARVTSVAPDGTATIQFSDLANRTFTLGEFFDAWGISFDRAHLGRQQALVSAPLRMSVNGDRNRDFDIYHIVGGERILVTYG
jgi:hypothetical protein